MADKNEKQDVTKFRVNRIQKLKDLYSDEQSQRRWADKNPSYNTEDFTSAAEVREALQEAISNRDTIVEASKKLFAINPIYSSVIKYLANLYMFRYKVIPHKTYTKSKAKLRKQIGEDDFQLIYNLMLEVVDGLSIESKFPSLLTLLFTCGAVYISTVCDEDSLTVDSILLPDKYCRKIGETQYGTAIIAFDFSYFESLGLTDVELKEFLKQFPSEFKTKYNKYKKDSSNYRWQQLDPHFSTGVLLNEVSIPTYFYLAGGILDYEKYQDNELERNENQLKYIVTHKMPIYQDKLIFEVDEVAAIHKSLKRIVDTGDKTRLITTYGDIEVKQIGESDKSENQVLSKAFKSIFNNAGFNSTIFAGESVEALKDSLIRDKTIVWGYIQQLINFYTIAINNWFDFKSYEANIEILPISQYTYNDDMEVFKNNASLGVGKLDYIIASGIKQKNVADQLNLETFLHLDEIQPMQTSYTQTADDRSSQENSQEVDSKKDNSKDESTGTGIEPSGNENSDNEDADNA